MHCDYLNVSVPETDSSAVDKKIVRLMCDIGAVAITDELFKIIGGSGGTLKHVTKRGFSFYSASGSLLTSLRSFGLYNDFLSVFSDHPHRVTKIDVAHDLPCSSQPLLDDIYLRANSGEIKLTRKGLNHVKKQFSVGVDGFDTGTVYLGARTAEVRARVYDKQQERLDKGFPWDDGPTTRFELTATNKVGISLKDAAEPSALFWRFMSDLLPAPANAPEWVPGGIGFVMPGRPDVLPVDLLKRKVSQSPEVQILLDLAADCGPKGLDMLFRLMRQRALSAPVVDAA